MLNEDLEPKRVIRSRFSVIRVYLGSMIGMCERCGRKSITERRRYWEMWRMQRDGGSIIWDDKEVN